MNYRRCLVRAASGLGTLYKIRVEMNTRGGTDWMREEDQGLYQALLTNLQLLFTIKVLHWQLLKADVTLILFVPAEAPSEAEARRRCLEYYSDKFKKQEYEGERLRDLSFFMFMLNRLFNNRRGEATGQLGKGHLWRKRYSNKIIDQYKLPPELGPWGIAQVQEGLSKLGIPRRQGTPMEDLPYESGGLLEGRKDFVRKTARQLGRNPRKGYWKPRQMTIEEMKALAAKYYDEDLERFPDEDLERFPVEEIPQQMPAWPMMPKSMLVFWYIAQELGALLFDQRRRWFRKKKNQKELKKDGDDNTGEGG